MMPAEPGVWAVFYPYKAIDPGPLDPPSMAFSVADPTATTRRVEPVLAWAVCEVDDPDEGSVDTICALYLTPRGVSIADAQGNFAGIVRALTAAEAEQAGLELRGR